MKTFIASVLLAAASGVSAAQEVQPMLFLDSFEVERMPFGSGRPAVAVTEGLQHADHIVDGLYHIPNYLPGFPTAATIWPREVAIECELDAVTGLPVCGGYRVHPAVGRGEYIFVRPAIRVVAPPPPPPPAPAPAPVVCGCCCEVQLPPLPLLPPLRKKPLG